MLSVEFEVCFFGKYNSIFQREYLKAYRLRFFTTVPFAYIVRGMSFGSSKVKNIMMFGFTGVCEKSVISGSIKKFILSFKQRCGIVLE